MYQVHGRTENPWSTYLTSPPQHWSFATIFWMTKICTTPWNIQQFSFLEDCKLFISCTINKFIQWILKTLRWHVNTFETLPLEELLWLKVFFFLFQRLSPSYKCQNPLFVPNWTASCELFYKQKRFGSLSQVAGWYFLTIVTTKSLIGHW